MTKRELAYGPLAIAVFATLCLVLILAPMRSVVLWATILAILFAGMNERLAKRFASRNRAAFATIGMILLTVVVPLILVSLLVAGQVNTLIGESDEIAASATQMFNEWLVSLPSAARAEIDSMIASIDIGAKEVGGMVGPAIAYTVSFGGNVAIGIGMAFAALYVAFFFLRDWRSILGFLSAAIPLKPEHKDVLSRRLSETISATVRGVILVAVIQSAVAGVVYWWLGLSAYAVLAVLTFIGCLIPAIGSGLIWVPVAIYFFVVGDNFSGFVMLAAGVLLIGMVDNVLRPRLIADKTALPDFLIFLSSFGGLALIGFDGLFLGPVIAAFFVESWKVYLGTSEQPLTDVPSTFESNEPPELVEER